MVWLSSALRAIKRPGTQAELPRYATAIPAHMPFNDKDITREERKALEMQYQRDRRAQGDKKKCLMLFLALAITILITLLAVVFYHPAREDDPNFVPYHISMFGRRSATVETSHIKPRGFYQVIGQFIWQIANGITQQQNTVSSIKRDVVAQSAHLHRRAFWQSLGWAIWEWISLATGHTRKVADDQDQAS